MRQYCTFVFLLAFRAFDCSNLDGADGNVPVRKPSGRKMVVLGGEKGRVKQRMTLYVPAWLR